MSNWRRQKPRNNNNNIKQSQQQWTRSSKPPLANCKQSVPAWEKEFCSVVGLIPWWKVLEAKRFMHLYDKVAEWDDSAGELAFKNAKARFWADMNGLPCDISLPDPSIYIDNVDWDAEVDNELILDLERGSNPCEKNQEIPEEEHVVILDPYVLSGQFSGPGWGTGWGTGWGDAEGVPENADCWETKEKISSWDDKNWKGKDQGRENWEWRKRGEVAAVTRSKAQKVSNGDSVEDCRWGNSRRRSRSRNRCQQHSNDRPWTKSF